MEADLETTSPVAGGGGGAGPGPSQHKHASSLSSSTIVLSPTASERAASFSASLPNHKRSSSNPDDATVKRIPEHDSLVTVRLSEPPRQLTVNTNVPPGGPTIQHRRSLFRNTLSPGSATTSSPLSSPFDPNEALSPISTVPGASLKLNLQDELESVDDDSKTINGAEEEESDDEEVNWEELQKTEDAESKHNEEDTTAMLLARLEQENDRLATNPKSVKVQAVEKLQQSARRPRPPSMAQLREMVQGPQPAPLRYSMLPPPPMTDLEFYAALVKDYQQTAARLPTLLANKIRKGIPPPLRGVVWQSMSLARDVALEDAFERYTGESSPYEGLIGKDLGRSFPGVEMFRDPEGDGQRMLGRVLKCYSLYDQKIGYCQGLALLVGPLLMHMSDKQAFCVLVKLMEQYDLRSSFLPDLYGLHVKIYQFRELLRDTLPALSDHLDDLQVDPAYVSQWFLSFFAVTCPLPMLFRIYDVIFAEGASETIMRVALSLMRRNQPRILALTEMGDVLQLLLSRSLWDAYHYNADEFVSDFVSLSPVVSRERLSALEQGYRESQLTHPPNQLSANAARSSEVTNAASRFLGRLWANSTVSLKASPTTTTNNNSPSSLTPSAASRPLSMLKRSASKQSLASTLNSMEASTSSTSSSASVLSTLSTVSTDATSISRDSTADDASNLARESKLSFQVNSDNRNLHNQIEDLLTALSDLQRQHSLLADQLQREREERDEDRKTVRTLLGSIRRQASSETFNTSHSGDSDATIKPDGINTHDGSLMELLDSMEGRFGEDDNKRRSSITQTKPQMRDDLTRAKEQLKIEMSKSQDANRRAVDLEQEVANVKDQLRESHAHVRNLHTEKQRLEKQIHSMRVRASDSAGNDSAAMGGWLSRSSSTRSTAPGLRELKLGRSQSTPSQISVTKRTSSFLGPIPPEPTPPAPTSAPQEASASEQEALLLDLVQAKTAEAVAKQDAEESKQKLEQLRKQLAAANEQLRQSMDAQQQLQQLQQQLQQSGGQQQSGQQLQQQAGVMGMFRSLTTPAPDSSAEAAKAVTPTVPATPTPAPAAPAASGGGGFWGWRK